MGRNALRLVNLVFVLHAFLCVCNGNAAEPVTITFSDIPNVAPNRDPTPPFTWRGVEFRGGWLREAPDDFWYVASPRSAIQMKFPPGSTEISFNVGGYGDSIILFEFMPLQVWNGSVGSGTVIRTLPLPPPSPNGPQPQYTRFDNLVTIPGPIAEVSIFTAPPPSGIRNYGNFILIDNVRYTPSDGDPSFLFELGPAKNEKVLIHNYGDALYPSPLQTEDRRIQVRGTATLNGQPAAGKTIYFRLLDPADTAPYTVQAGDAQPNDNVDGPGTLNGQGAAVVQAVTDAAGKVSLTLEITGKTAGDNYQVEASTKPAFPCSPCSRSAVYTAWKRAYVEVNKMFRHGAYITENVVPGAKAIHVDNVNDFPDPPFQVRLIHAPKTIGGGSDFYEELVTVFKVSRNGVLPVGVRAGVLHLNPDTATPGVQKVYFNADADRVGAPDDEAAARAYLADAVGVITGDRSADYFLPSATLVQEPFADAFIEHVWLTDAEAGDQDLAMGQLRRFHDGVIPYDPNMDDGVGPAVYQSEWMARKWMRSATRAGQERSAKANHHVLFTATTHPRELGFCRVGSGFNDLWFFVKRAGTDTLAAESLVHELAHEWRVNGSGNGGGHCNTALGADQKMYNRNRKCTMHGNMYGNPGDAERNDGLVGFHYLRSGEARDSEYLHMRSRDEPIPQNELQRPQPQ